jgi:hypothetical protein
MPAMIGEIEKGISIDGDQDAAPRKAVLGHRPGGGDAEGHVQRHDDDGDNRGQPDRVQRHRVQDVGGIDLPARARRRARR